MAQFAVGPVELSQTYSYGEFPQKICFFMGFPSFFDAVQASIGSSAMFSFRLSNVYLFQDMGLFIGGTYKTDGFPMEFDTDDWGYRDTSIVSPNLLPLTSFG